MKIIALIEFLRRHLTGVIRLGWAVLAGLVISDALWVNKEHAHTAPEHWIGFWSAFGFIACVLIIFFSKWFGHRGIMTREDYYGDE